MEALLKFWNYIAHSNVINFIIMVFLLYKIVKKCKLDEVFNNAIKQVETKITDSDTQKSKSKQNLDKAQELLDNLPKDIEDLEKSSADKIKNFNDKIEDNTKKSITHIEENAVKTIQLEEKKISNILTQQTSVASIELAKQQLTKMLKGNEELHTKFIQDSLDELDKVKL